MTNYPPADTRAQWFQGKWPGADMHLTAANTVLVLHTTEGVSWPDYMGGAEAPTYTAKPRIARKGLDWRAHFPDEKSARALENHPGGVETNALNCVQVELIGTCDPKHQDTWPGVGRAGADYIFWPDAPDWLLAELAKFVAYLHNLHGLQLNAAKFIPYPASISGVRFTNRQWETFAGICGHMHVPENSHGDPGNLDVAKLVAMTRALLDPPKPPPAAPKPPPPTAHVVARAPRRAVFHVDHGGFYYTEDSLRGVRAALAKRFGWIDLDVCKLKDGTLVVAHGPQPLLKRPTGGFHDPTGRVTDPNVRFSQLTWAQVQNFRSNDGKGYRIRKASELIPAAVKAGIRVEFEAKSADITKADLLALHLDPKRVQVKGFPDKLPALLAAHQAGYTTIVLTHPGHTAVPVTAQAWLDYFRGDKPRWVE